MSLYFILLDGERVPKFCQSPADFGHDNEILQQQVVSEYVCQVKNPLEDLEQSQSCLRFEIYHHSTLTIKVTKEKSTGARSKVIIISRPEGNCVYTSTQECERIFTVTFAWGGIWKLSFHHTSQ